MGMTLMQTYEVKEAGFNLYFVGYPGDYDYKKPAVNGVIPIAGAEGLLELTWNYGKQKQNLCLGSTDCDRHGEAGRESLP